MTKKQLHKVITANCDKIAEITAEILTAVEEFDDEEMYEVTSEWIEVINQCIGEELNHTVDRTVADTLEFLN